MIQSIFLKELTYGMNEFWNQFQGRTVGDSYVLGQIVGSNEESAVYLTDLPDGSPAAAKLRLGAPGEEHRRLDTWFAAAELSHPNLVQIYGAGTATLSGYSIDYVVMERADETLASVLAQRALSEEEAREMFSPALTAVSYLHHRDFVHGSLHPANVMAVGETLKLSSDNILRIGQSSANRSNSAYDCPEREVSPASPKWDSWSLGALLVGSLTLRVPPVQEGEIELPELQPAFSDVARHTLVANPEQRWDIRQIVSSLENPTVNGATPTLEATPAEKRIEDAPDYHKRMLADRAEIIPDSNSEPTQALPKWLVPAVILGIAIVLLLVWLGKGRSGSTTAQSVSPVRHTMVPRATSVPVPQKPSPGTIPAKAVPVPIQQTRPQGAWYVVVATYSKKIDADKRARSITARWPKYHASVFDPPVKDPHHLVVIGANLSEDAADALRKHARADGLPNDIYIKKFIKARS
jgi:hypothetical protein